ncbi:unnamed protein product [Adineta ricciae]|uniref:Uncharacterized protein n=1 Tax=Adineta ricciae TaxID=249248 RepID=A0A815Q6X3_ADIRI|nr:unnamed protein product [Adineta ricciae]CAF1459154.1 unnamed protein product [Adineta ricciae]
MLDLTGSETSLRLIVSSIHTPTTGISKFLDRLLQPLFDKHARSTTVIDGVDIIRRLKTYVTNGYLKPTTYLCTFDITDLYTVLSQEESLKILTESLLKHVHSETFRYPPRFIHSQIKTFLSENDIKCPVVPQMQDDHQFHIVRHQLLNKPTVQAMALQSRVFKIT